MGLNINGFIYKTSKTFEEWLTGIESRTTDNRTSASAVCISALFHSWGCFSLKSDPRATPHCTCKFFKSGREKVEEVRPTGTWSTYKKQRLSYAVPSWEVTEKSPLCKGFEGPRCPSICTSSKLPGIAIILPSSEARITAAPCLKHQRENSAHVNFSDTLFLLCQGLLTIPSNTLHCFGASFEDFSQNHLCLEKQGMSPWKRDILAYVYCHSIQTHSGIETLVIVGFTTQLACGTSCLSR